MILFENINKTFLKKEILSSISGSFAAGETSLIIGGSGMGKTVLMKCIAGLMYTDSGTVHYDNKRFISTSRGKVERVIRRKIGMLFQGVALFDSKNVEENVRFPLDVLTNMTAKEKRKQVDFCLDKVQLPGIGQKMPSELSGGMKKRVGIARAIVNNPSYLFCDEPNSGLDPQTALRIDQLIAEITKEYNITTAVVTHDMNSVLEIGNHILFIYYGKKLWEGNKEQILTVDVPQVHDFIFANKSVRALMKKT